MNQIKFPKYQDAIKYIEKYEGQYVLVCSIAGEIFTDCYRNIHGKVERRGKEEKWSKPVTFFDCEDEPCIMLKGPKRLFLT